MPPWATTYFTVYDLWLEMMKANKSFAQKLILMAERAKVQYTSAPMAHAGEQPRINIPARPKNLAASVAIESNQNKSL